MAQRRNDHRQPPPEGPDFGKVAKGSQAGPPVDPDAVLKELDPAVRRELSSLPGTLAEKVAAHLIMTARLLDDDPELALAHATTGHDLAPRILAVREALAIASYRSGDYRTALREARTVRRMAGDESWLPVIADCERGLGRPERALDLLLEVPIAELPSDVQTEALLVLSGARADLGQHEAAAAVLDVPLLRRNQKTVQIARLRLAYAAALDALDRSGEATQWVALAVAADPDDITGAADLLADRQGTAIPEIADLADLADLTPNADLTDVPDDQP